jgi:hypothetical protein
MGGRDRNGVRRSDIGRPAGNSRNHRRTGRQLRELNVDAGFGEQAQIHGIKEISGHVDGGRGNAHRFERLRSGRNADENQSERRNESTK